MPLLRVVVDPGVLVSALISPAGPTSRLLDALRAGECVVVVCPTLLEELADVLSRDKFRPYVTLDEVATYIEGIADIAEAQDDPVDVSAVSRDPDDDYLVALVRSSHADALVSGDSDLEDLDLADVPVLAPRAFIDRLAASAERSTDPK